MKRIFSIISVFLTVILTGCSTVSGLSVSASGSAVAAPTPGLSRSSIMSPSPSPTAAIDPIESMFNTPDEPSQEIGDVISAGGNIYYFTELVSLNTSIRILDVATQKSKFVLKTKTYTEIEGMFLDQSGNLYYWAQKSYEDIQNETSDIIKYDGKKQIVILKDVANIYKVDNNYIYFSVHNNDYWDGLFLKKYDLKTGETEDVSIDENGYIIPLCIFRNKPIMLFRYTAGDYGDSYYICNINTGIVQPISSLDEYSISLDQKSIMFYDYDGLYVDVFSLENEFSSVHIQVPLDQLFGLITDTFICNGRELQFIIGNYYYAVEISTGKLLEKMCLIDDKDYESYLPVTCRLLNGKWYALVQKPLAYKPNSQDDQGDGLLIEVQPALYTINIASHELKCIWKEDSYKNNEYAGLDFIIQNGRVCLYGPFWNIKWMIIPLSDVDKGQ